MVPDWHWPAGIGAALVLAACTWWLGYRAGSHGVLPGETKTVVSERIVKDTAEEDRLRKQLAEVTARKNNVTTVEVIREVPGGERIVTRTIKDTSTEDVKATAVETREVVRVEKVTVDRLVTVTPAPRRWGASLLGGVDAATWRPVVGVVGEYRWARLVVSADPREPSKVAVMAGIGVHW